MLELSKDMQAVFPIKRQRAFLESVQKKMTLTDMARLCKCSERTMRDWHKEKFPMQLICVRILCKKTHIRLPSDFTKRSRYAHTSYAGVLGARALFRKYGRFPVNQTYRKLRWRQWWNQKGKSHLPPAFVARKVHMPAKSVILSEFIGIMMGDGGMSTYQAVITLHHIDDLAYLRFVKRQIKKLFRISPRIYHSPEDSVNYITVSRKELVKYLHRLGLPVGNKVRRQFDIPTWIQQNKSFSLACVRGLIDTDGSVFTHRYIVNSKRYSYKKLSFCSRSEPLRLSVWKILKKAGMSPRLSRYEVHLDSVADVRRYFSVIGSHNPKHLKRYQK